MLFQQRKVQHSLLSHGPHCVNSRRVQWRRRRAGQRAGSEGGVRGWGQRVGSEGGVRGWGQRVGSEGGVRGRGQRAGSEGGVRGYGHHGYRIRRLCLPFFFPHFSLTPFSINNHQFLLFLLLFSICLPLFPKFSPPKAFSVSLASFVRPLSGHMLSVPVVHLPLCQHGRTASNYSSPISYYNFPPLQLPLSVRPLVSYQLS